MAIDDRNQFLRSTLGCHADLADGLGAFLIVQIPIILMAATTGVWLFYIQHQFEETHWSDSPDWNHQNAALHDSSHYDLPPVLCWFTGNIGVHHVHHLSSKVPFYRLPQVLRDIPELHDTGRIPYDAALAKEWLTKPNFMPFADVVTWAASVVDKGRAEAQGDLEKTRGSRRWESRRRRPDPRRRSSSGSRRMAQGILVAVHRPPDRHGRRAAAGSIDRSMDRSERSG